MNFETSEEIELAIAHWFGVRTHIIVPNLSWGMLPYECDLAILPRRSDYLYEVEIKVSRSDLIRDKSKSKWNYNSYYRIRKLWFAIPEKLKNSIDHIPNHAGILVVGNLGVGGSVIGEVTQIRRPIVDKLARKMTASEKFQLATLGALRIWSLKEGLMWQRRNGMEGDPC